MDRIDISTQRGKCLLIMKHKPQMMKMRWLGVAVLLSLYTSSALAFNIDDVAKQAKSMAGKSYEAPKSNLPSVFRDMKYADYQQIQFNHDKAYWNNIKTPFKLEFYHQGMYFDTCGCHQRSDGDRGTQNQVQPGLFQFWRCATR